MRHVIITTNKYLLKKHKIFGNHLLKFIKPELLNEYINFDEDYPLKIEHLLNTANFLQQKVKYFSINQLLQYTLTRTNIEGSRAFFLNEVIKTNENIYTINLPFYHQNIFTFDHKKIILLPEIFNIPEKSIEFIYLAQLEGWFFREHQELSLLLLGAKILSSSFFLNEITNFFQYTCDYTLDNNKFFNNFSDFLIWSEILNFKIINKIEFKQFDSFSDAFNYLKKDNMMNIINLNFAIINENYYYPIGYSYNQNIEINTNIPTKLTINLENKFPFKREIRLDGKNYELYGDTFYFYMYEVLQLSSNSINTMLIKQIYSFFLQNIEIKNNPLFLNFNAMLKFLTDLKEKIYILNNQIFLEKLPLFFILTISHLNKIKRFARNKNLREILVINLKDFSQKTYKLLHSKKYDYIDLVY